MIVSCKIKTLCTKRKHTDRSSLFTYIICHQINQSEKFQVRSIESRVKRGFIYEHTSPRVFKSVQLCWLSYYLTLSTDPLHWHRSTPGKCFQRFRMLKPHRNTKSQMSHSLFLIRNFQRQSLFYWSVQLLSTGKKETFHTRWHESNRRWDKTTSKCDLHKIKAVL